MQFYPHINSEKVLYVSLGRNLYINEILNVTPWTKYRWLKCLLRNISFHVKLVLNAVTMVMSAKVSKYQ